MKTHQPKVYKIGYWQSDSDTTKQLKQNWSCFKDSSMLKFSELEGTMFKLQQGRV